MHPNIRKRLLVQVAGCTFGLLRLMDDLGA